MSKQKHLSDLYPFLHGRKQDGESMERALLTSVRQKAADHARVFEDYLLKTKTILSVRPKSLPKPTAKTGAYSPWAMAGQY